MARYATKEAHENHKAAKRKWSQDKRNEMTAKGMVQISGFVYANQKPEIMALIELLQSNPDYSIATLRDLATGKYLKVL